MPSKRVLIIAALGSVSAVSVLVALWWQLGALIDKSYDEFYLDDYVEYSLSA